MPGVRSEAPTWPSLYRRLPAELRAYALEEAWDRERLWALDLPVEEMLVAELLWQLALPWWRVDDRYFSVSPLDVLARPDAHPEQLRRTLEADVACPLEVTWRNGRWVVLDGLHRLLRAAMLEAELVRVRKVPARLLAEIASEYEEGLTKQAPCRRAAPDRRDAASSVAPIPPVSALPASLPRDDRREPCDGARSAKPS